MKFSTSIQSFAAAVLLTASATSALAELTPASVSGTFSANLGTFEVLSQSNVVGSLGYVKEWDFGGVSYELHRVNFSGGSISGTSGLYDFTGANFSFTNMAPGSYSVHASGKVSGPGLIAASLNVTLVPEPESYAMLLAGLGLMGGIARRRANKQQA